jgi:hypothetical protein
MLLQFVRDKKNQRVGMVVAVPDEYGKVGVGWSKCKTSMDKFSEEQGKMIALQRASHARSGGKFKRKMPQCVQKVYDSMTDRATRYYKDKEVMVIE